MRYRVEVRWVDPRLPRVWQIGYVEGGEFHPWAGGSSDAALERMIASETARSPHDGVTDRRRHAHQRPKEWDRRVRRGP